MYAKAFVPNKYLQKQSPGEKIALTQLEMQFYESQIGK